MGNNNWFEVKCRYEKMMESGMVKMVTEPYLIDAYSFTEAEARGVEEITPFMEGEFELTAVSKKRFAEVILDYEGDRYFLAVLELIVLDEKSGTEKKTKSRVLAQANNLQGALDAVNKFMDDAPVDYSIYSVAETAIVDVFVYKSAEKEVKE